MAGVEIVVCEGDSEVAYVNELNRLLYRDPFGFKMLAFRAVCAESGHFDRVKRAVKTEKAANPSSRLLVWADYDVYCRNDLNNRVKYQNRKGLPDFLFSVMNFEDFLMMHCETPQLKAWTEVCRRHRHFEVPMHAQEYEPLFRDFWPDYQKGDMPFELTRQRLEQMFVNLEISDMPIRNGFGQYVRDERAAGRLKFR